MSQTHHIDSSGRENRKMNTWTETISNSFSKIDSDEEMSVSRACMEDAARRLADSAEREPISSERLSKGNTLLDTYTIASDVISGGMGNVWRVRNENWGKYLAMKRPQPRFFTEAGSGRKEEFIRECENWINLGMHPEIVSCFYVREIGGVPTIFSEWMNGGSLKDRMNDGSLYAGTPEEVQERIFDIAVQAARGLLYAHECGLIHQDMKPGNLLLTRRWKAKVADFGLAKAASSLTDKGETLSTGYTPAYCPAEQMTGGTAAPWMDMYAWALTVLEMYGKGRLWKDGPDAAAGAGRYIDMCPIPVPGKIRELLLECLSAGRTGTHPVTDSRLTSIYSEVFGRDYPRPLYPSGRISAEALNNRALSFLDLGKPELAEMFWRKALETDNSHVDTIVNQSLYLWRCGKKTDLETRERLSEIEDEFTREEVLSEFCAERGSDSFTLEYPAPVTGELPGSKIPQVLTARIDGNILSFAMKEPDGGFYVVRRYDVETGRLLETLPEEEQPRRIKSDWVYLPVLGPDGERMLIYDERKTKLWDTRRQKIIADFNDTAYVFTTDYDSVDIPRYRHIRRKYHYPEHSPYFTASNRPPEGMTYQTAQKYSDGSIAANLGQKGLALYMDEGCAMLVSNGTSGLDRYFYDLTDDSYLTKLPRKEYENARNFGVFRDASGKSLYWDGCPGRSLDFYCQQGKELKPTRINTPWNAKRPDPENDYFAVLGQVAMPLILQQRLYIYEPSSGRIVNTTTVLSPAGREDMKDPYPYLLTDYENGRIILYFVSSSSDIPMRPMWYVLPVPGSGIADTPMSYRVSYPASVRTVYDAGELVRKAEILLDDKDADHTSELLSLYRQMKGIPMMEGPQVRRTLEAMNRILYMRCTPTGVRSVQDMDREEPDITFSYSWQKDLLNRKIYNKEIVHTEFGSYLFYLVNIEGSVNERKVMVEKYGKDEQLILVKEFETPENLGAPVGIAGADPAGRYVLAAFGDENPRTGYYEINEHMLLDSQSGKMTFLKSLCLFNGTPVISPDGNTIWILDKNAVHVCHTGSDSVETITTADLSFPDRAVFRKLQFTPDGSRALLSVWEDSFTSLEECRSSLVLWDTRTGSRRTFFSCAGDASPTSMTFDAGFVLLRGSFPEEGRIIYRSMILRTDDGKCLWKRSGNTVKHVPGIFSSDSVFLLSQKDLNPSLSVYWEFS